MCCATGSSGTLLWLRLSSFSRPPSTSWRLRSWTKYTLRASPQAPALVFAAVFVVAILSVSVWSRLVRRVGTKRAWSWSIGIVLFATILSGLVPNLVVGVIVAAVVGLGLGGTQVCREMILAKLVDGSLERTGRRQEGIYYSLSMLFGRLSKIVQALALLLMLLLFGYVSGEDPGPHPDTAFRFLIGVLPLVCLVPAWILARRFPMRTGRMSCRLEVSGICPARY